MAARHSRAGAGDAHLGDDDAQSPNITSLDFEDVPVLSFALTSDSDSPSLFRVSKNLKKTLEDLPSVSKVNLTGTEEEEISITLKTGVSLETGLSPLSLIRIIQSEITNYPSGLVETDESVFAVSVDAPSKSLDDLMKYTHNYKQY